MFCRVYRYRSLSGTKLHQQTRKAISKRTPALMTAIRRFNKYRAELSRLHDPAWNFPLPDPLPEELNTLREDSSLLADVWISRLSPTVPRWLEDANIRAGIRAVLARDRCEEERRRLEMEAENLCRSYGLNIAAVELAMRLPTSTLPLLSSVTLAERPRDAPIMSLLKHQKEQLLLLRFRWRNPLIPDHRFQALTAEASKIAQDLSGLHEPQLDWIRIDIAHEWEDDASEFPDAEMCLARDLLEVLDNDPVDSDKPTLANSDGPATDVVLPMIERTLHLSDSNPASKSAQYAIVALMFFVHSLRFFGKPRLPCLLHQSTCLREPKQHSPFSEVPNTNAIFPLV